MSTEAELIARYEAEIDGAGFTPAEVAAFRVDYRLAIVAGMGVGYRMAERDHAGLITRYEKVMDDLVGLVRGRFPSEPKKPQ